MFNLDPPVTDDEVREASLQFVRKISGYNKPSRANQEAFDTAVEKIAAVASELLDSLETNAAPKDRAIEAEKARERAVRRFGS